MATPALSKRVLLVAPADASRQALATRLGAWGLEVLTSQHPLESAVLLYQGWERAQPFDLILFSPEGHDVDPAAFAAVIRADQRADGIALVHVGEVQDIGERGRLRQAGFIDFLGTEADTPVLFDAVQRGLARQEAPRHPQPGVVQLSDYQVTRRPGHPRLNILIADPNPEHRRIARGALANVGYRLTEVAAGEEVLTALAKRAFDVVVLALDCGDYMASELIGVVRFSTAADRSPTFIGVGEPALAQADDFARVVDLPLRGPALKRAVEEVARLETVAPPEAPPAPIPRLDQRALAMLHRINPSPEFLPKVIREFFRQVEEHLNDLRHCYGAALCHRTLRDFGHELADMAGHLGALELHQLGLIAANFPEQLFESQGHQMIGRIEVSFSRTREVLEPYLEAKSCS